MGSCAATYLIVLPLRRTTANMAKRIIDPIGVAARRAARAQIGRLRDSKIQRATFLRYFTAVYTFCHHLSLYNQTMAESFECLDSQLNIYIEWLWESGQSLNDAKDVLSGCSHFLNTRRRFPGAWRLVSIWRQMDLPERAPALPPVVMQAMLGLCLQHGWISMAATLCLGWSCILRTTEMIHVLSESISIDAATCTGAVSLGLTKTGKRQGAAEMCSVDDAVCGWLVLWGLQILGSCYGPRAKYHPLMNCSPSMFRRVFDLLLEQLGLANHYRPYSIRRGAATALYRTCRDIQTTLFKGRWSDARTGRIYITEGAAAWAKQTALPPAVTQYALVFRQCLEQHQIPLPATLDHRLI